MVTTWPFSDPWKWIKKDFLMIIQITDTMHAVRVGMLWKQFHIVNKNVQLKSLKLLRNYFTLICISHMLHCSNGLHLCYVQGAAFNVTHFESRVTHLLYTTINTTEQSQVSHCLGITKSLTSTIQRLGDVLHDKQNNAAISQVHLPWRDVVCPAYHLQSPDEFQF